MFMDSKLFIITIDYTYNPHLVINVNYNYNYNMTIDYP
jgi:hypothetical protein